MKGLDVRFKAGYWENIVLHFTMKGLDVRFIIGCWENIVQQIRGDAKVEPRLEGMFRGSET